MLKSDLYVGEVNPFIEVVSTSPTTTNSPGTTEVSTNVVTYEQTTETSLLLTSEASTFTSHGTTDISTEIMTEAETVDDTTFVSSEGTPIVLEGSIYTTGGYNWYINKNSD